MGNLQNMENNLGCGKMYCFIEGCGEYDETHTAYCVKHGRSPHRICSEGKTLCPECENHSQFESNYSKEQRVSDKPDAVVGKTARQSSGSFNKKLKEIYGIMKRKEINTVEQIEEMFSSDSEFNLSKKIYKTGDEDVLHIVDIKEFIRRLKEKINDNFLKMTRRDLIKFIDRISGNELNSQESSTRKDEVNNSKKVVQFSTPDKLAGEELSK